MTVDAHLQVLVSLRPSVMDPTRVLQLLLGPVRPVQLLVQEGWRTLEALQDEGLVKAIGIYTSKPDMLRRLLDVCQVPPSAVDRAHCSGNLQRQAAAALSHPPRHVRVWFAGGTAFLPAPAPLS